MLSCELALPFVKGLSHNEQVKIAILRVILRVDVMDDIRLCPCTWTPLKDCSVKNLFRGWRCEADTRLNQID